MTNLSTPIRRIKSFTSQYFWLIKDAFIDNKKIIVIIVIVDAIGAILSRGGTIAFVSFLVKLMQSEREIELFNFKIVVSYNIYSILLLSLTLFLMLGISAWANYYSTAKMRLIGRKYNFKCAGRVLDYLQQIRLLQTLNNSIFDIQHIQNQINRNSLQIGIAVETIIKSLQPIWQCIVCLVAILYLDTTLSLAIALIFLALAPIVYKISSDIQKTSRSYYNILAIERAKNVRGFVQYINNNELSLNHRDSYLKKLEQNESMLNCFDSFDQNKLANDKFILYMAYFKASVFSLFVFVFGYISLRTSNSLSTIVSYSFALLYLLNSLQSLGGYFANLNRFYPQITSYLEFCNTAKNLIDNSLSYPLREQMITISSNPVLNCSLATAEINLGEPTVYYCGMKLNRLNFNKFIHPLVSSSSISARIWSNANFVSTPHIYLPGSFLDNIMAGNINEQYLDKIKLIIQEFDLWEEINQLSSSWDTIITDELWENISPKLKAIIKIIPAIFSAGKIIFLDYIILKDIPMETCQQILNYFHDKFTFIAVKRGEFYLNLPLDTIVVADEKQIIGIGDRQWFQEIRSDVLNLYEDLSKAGYFALDDNTSSTDELLMDS